jgi:hypothetical protein
MIPYTAYDIIKAVNREFDLKRQPIREHYHSFGADGNQPPEDGQNDPSGPDRPVSPGLFARLIAAIRSIGRQSPKTQSAETS